MAMSFSNDTLLLFRVCGKAVDATKLMFAKDFAVSHESKSDSEDTLDGSFTTGGGAESSLKYTAKMASGDTFSDEVEDALLDKIPYEAWVIDSKMPGKDANANKYKSRYFQGYFSKYDLKGEASAINEYETEFSVSGRMQRGYATLPKVVEDKLSAIGYKFHDTTKEDPANDGLANIPQPTGTVTPTV